MRFRVGKALKFVHLWNLLLTSFSLRCILQSAAEILTVQNLDVHVCFECVNAYLGRTQIESMAEKFWNNFNSHEEPEPGAPKGANVSKGTNFWGAHTINASGW